MKDSSEASAEQIANAKKLLGTVRHAAYATVNKDGTPHNSPLMLIYDEDLTKLYIGSHSDSLHSKNIERTGKAFVVLFDSFVKGQGGVYITAVNGHECQGEELAEALRVHNAVRARYGSNAIEQSFYMAPKPAQRMYSLDIEKIEVYSPERNSEGLIVQETRAQVSATALLEA